MFMVKEHALRKLQFLHMTKDEGRCSLVAWYRINFAIEELKKIFFGHWLSLYIQQLKLILKVCCAAVMS